MSIRDALIADIANQQGLTDSKLADARQVIDELQSRGIDVDKDTRLFSDYEQAIASDVLEYALYGNSGDCDWASTNCCDCN